MTDVLVSDNTSTNSFRDLLCVYIYIKKEGSQNPAALAGNSFNEKRNIGKFLRFSK